MLFILFHQGSTFVYQWSGVIPDFGKIQDLEMGTIFVGFAKRESSMTGEPNVCKTGELEGFRCHVPCVWQNILKI